MAKASSLKLVSELSQSNESCPGKNEVLANVRLNIEEAVRQLRSLGRDYERAAWMLEDSLNYALSEGDKSIAMSDEIYAAQGVDWASLIQAEELFEASR